MISGIVKTFKRGIHPPEHKALSCANGIEVMPLPTRVVIPLQQHIGRMSQAIVQTGDRVLRGPGC